MTSKELLYVEDALGHEQFFQTKCRETVSQLQDECLKNCVSELAHQHEQIFSNLFGLLN
ncbi:MAG: hypothetical protein IJJ69_05180 [Oscillospiraceae bacterium]|nr:hypothetical protein [Oscillospiraceae bacterium]